eukprot:14047003-Ditylum_brightwellii.AAC.1
MLTTEPETMKLLQSYWKVPITDRCTIKKLKLVFLAATRFMYYQSGSDDGKTIKFAMHWTDSL